MAGRLNPDGETSGTIGESKRLEAIKISLKKLRKCIRYISDPCSDLWLVELGERWFLIGTVNESKRLEAIEIKLEGTDASKYDIYYRGLCPDIWLAWLGKERRECRNQRPVQATEAIQIKVMPKGSAAPGEARTIVS